MDKQFAVLGLGSFGSSVALTLENMGCDVLVVDESYEKVQEISTKFLTRSKRTCQSLTRCRLSEDVILTEW